MTLFDQIHASSKLDNLDDAIRPIQEILGQDDGGIAGNFFSGFYEDGWPQATIERRVYLLIRYIAHELNMTVAV